MAVEIEACPFLDAGLFIVGLLLGVATACSGKFRPSLFMRRWLWDPVIVS
ncbi:hypothetical protein V8F20_007409 [Naviculisporaceae sp. PSN 640]